MAPNENKLARCHSVDWGTLLSSDNRVAPGFLFFEAINNAD
jgi:hypothetical protein